MREGQDFNHRNWPLPEISDRVHGTCRLPAPPACSWFRPAVRRDNGPISLLDASCPHRVLSGGFPDADGDAVLVFPIVEHSLYPQLRTEGFKVLL